MFLVLRALPITLNHNQDFFYKNAMSLALESPQLKFFSPVHSICILSPYEGWEHDKGRIFSLVPSFTLENNRVTLIFTNYNLQRSSGCRYTSVEYNVRVWK